MFPDLSNYFGEYNRVITDRNGDQTYEYNSDSGPCNKVPPRT